MRAVLHALAAAFLLVATPGASALTRHHLTTLSEGYALRGRPTPTPPRPGDAVLWGQRLRMGGLLRLVTNATAAREFAIYQIFIGVPNWNVTSTQFMFASFVGLGSGVSPNETLPTGNVSILGAEVWSGNPDAGGTAVEALKFSGVATLTISPGGMKLSDALAATLTAGTPVYLRLAVDRGLNAGSFPQGYARQKQNGEKIQYSSTAAAVTSLLSSGTITDDTASFTSADIYTFYGPIFAVGKGWDGRKVALLFGHSIVAGEGHSPMPSEAADARGNVVFAAKALDSSSLTAGRVSFGNLALGGINMLQRSLNPSSSDYYYRLTALRMVAAQQGGRWPFTDVFFDIANNGRSSDILAWEGALKSSIGFVHGIFPGVPIVMPTMTARTSNANSQYWTTLADQTFTVENGPGPSAPRQQVDAYILSTPALDRAIDMRAVIVAGNNDKWPLSAFTTTLASAAAVGAGSVSLSAAPAVGADLVFDPGNASTAEVKVAVKSVTGTGPYTVVFTEGTTLSFSHSAGSVVKEAFTADGLHPAIDFNESVLKPAMVNAINAQGMP